MKKTLVSFHNFSYKYNSQESPTLTDINLEIHAGEKLLIAGPSGSGKSTLGYCINGLIPNAFKGEISGSIRVAGADTRTMSLFDLSKIVGTVLQDTDAQFIGLTVGEDIAFSLENDGVALPEMKKRVHLAAARVGMEAFVDQSPHELSGGQKQRVSMAGVLVDPVNILLFDEPLANLDPAAGRQTMQLIDRIQRESGLTVVIIEHRLEEVLEVSPDRIVVLADGRIVADAEPDELLSTDVLLRNGIREPLYLSALKRAGVDVVPDLHPSDLGLLKIDLVREPLKRWFDQNVPSVKASQGKTILALDHVSFHYTTGTEVLRDVSISVRRGERVAIVGKNGAGKSTLTKLICGLEHPRSGTLAFYGRNMEEWTIKERSAHIGLVMQDPNQMISQQMIFDEVALGLRIRGTDPDEMRSRVYETLKICGLYPFRNWPVSALSFGQKKRVTIASILVLRPEIIILDEPTAGQDYRHYTEIMNFLDQLNGRGMTVIMITHDMHLMLEYTDRAIVMADGLKIADELPARLLSDQEMAAQASLRTTSLFRLAGRAGFPDPAAFVEHFILSEKEERSHHENADANLY
ncbi:ABC transporter ATP-binding protein [Sporolactobacillus shoreae]|uniref:ABC transporter ATP-binding protein n=1 Tax=Sporolactobacillus shoreae TaxID=1465501 RepID=A0A4Z0GKT8_9BACL|nr:ABC transporter ATP-binding protein [Sporolactobacillus shoreae]TGA97499.1 ABC transporter ATP-binding protein [Sporolactobacillus shoreae]